MRWGEPRKLPPLTRSRGMFAASLLAVAVLAAYAGLAMLSLGVSSPLSVAVSSVKGAVGNFTWHQPSVKDVVSVRQSSAGVPAGVLADQTPIDFGRATADGGTKTFSINNTSGKALPLVVTVVGAHGVSASFTNGGSTVTLEPKHQAQIQLSTDPMQAGLIRERSRSPFRTRTSPPSPCRSRVPRRRSRPAP